MNYVEDSGATKPRCWHVTKYNQNNQPVVCVDWMQIPKYYRKSLPTEIQYEKAVKQTKYLK